MADAKITELTELTSPAGTDLLPIVDDVGGSPITKKISLTNLLSIGSATSHIIGEVVSGDIDGVNDEFTLANTPISGTVRVYHNRTRLKLTDDYTISGAVITLIDIPVTGDVVVADYMISAGDFATGSASFVSNEVPSGLVNSSNVTFTLVSTPVTGTLQLFRDGQLMKGGGVDYTLTTNSIEFVTAPTTGSVLLAFYQSSVSTVGNADLLDGQHASELSPSGMVVPFAGASAPSGWLLADGSAVSRSTYSALFTVISTTYGSGDGSTTFNLPDLKGRVAVGKSTDTEFDALGETGGAKTVAGDAHTHTLSDSGQAKINLNGTYVLTKEVSSGSWSATRRTNSVGGTDSTLSSDSRGAGLDGSTDSTTPDATSVLQPYITLNYIIKT